MQRLTWVGRGNSIVYIYIYMFRYKTNKNKQKTKPQCKSGRTSNLGPSRPPKSKYSNELAGSFGRRCLRFVFKYVTHVTNSVILFWNASYTCNVSSWTRTLCTRGRGEGGGAYRRTIRRACTETQSYGANLYYCRFTLGSYLRNICLQCARKISYIPK